MPLLAAGDARLSFDAPRAACVRGGAKMDSRVDVSTYVAPCRSSSLTCEPYRMLARRCDYVLEHDENRAQARPAQLRGRPAMRPSRLLARRMSYATVTRKEDAGRATGPRERARERDDATSRDREGNLRAGETENAGPAVLDVDRSLYGVWWGNVPPTRPLCRPTTAEAVPPIPSWKSGFCTNHCPASVTYIADWTYVFRTVAGPCPPEPAGVPRDPDDTHAEAAVAGSSSPEHDR